MEEIPKLMPSMNSLWAIIGSAILVVLTAYIARRSPTADKKIDAQAGFLDDVLEELKNVKENQVRMEEKYRDREERKEAELMRYRFGYFRMLEWCSSMRADHIHLRSEVDRLVVEAGKPTPTWPDIPPIPLISDFKDLVQFERWRAESEKVIGETG